VNLDCPLSRLGVAVQDTKCRANADDSGPVISTTDLPGGGRPAGPMRRKRDTRSLEKADDLNEHKM